MVYADESEMVNIEINKDNCELNDSFNEYTIGLSIK